MSESNQQNTFNSVNLISLFLNWWKQLVIVGVLAVVFSSIASFMITPKYKSEVIMFPTQTNSISKALLNENNSGKEDILKFGEEEEAEQMLQILNSDYIRNRICNKYDLMKHYDINPKNKFKNTLLFKEFEDNINFERTEFMSVKVTVLDKDPQMAADITNDIAALVDSVKNEMQHERARQGLKIVELALNSQKEYIKSIEDSLNNLRKLGINDYETQSQAFNEQYALAISKNNTAGIKSLEEKLLILSTYGGAYVSLREKLQHELNQLSIIKSKYEQAKIDAEQFITSKFIVNKAFKAEKKSYPIRWLIVVVSTVSALLISLLAILLIENVKEFKLSKK
ncbi:MAG: hypothetical protein IT238_10390 [Bacteroidia bacterium]|nr:hypothetical protein [Bacteroidia bacterium]MCZ2247997.1 hypothetical protein [Bacteroidia bacterium]